MKLLLTTVLFFGGYGSTPQQMTCWEKGAQEKYKKSGVSFQAIAYPTGTGPDMQSAIRDGAESIQHWVTEINQHPDKKYVIVGHSSGTALANRVAELVDRPQQIELVDLDGFAASRELQKKIKTTCVYAVQTKTGMLSTNAKSMKLACSKRMEYRDSRCETEWCLHYSLVNAKTPQGLTRDQFKKDGYKSCDTNLDWLDLVHQPIPAGQQKPTGVGTTN